MATVTLTKTDVGRNLYRDSAKGAASPLIKYIALGTSNTAPSSADTKLGTEAFRKAITTYTNGSTGEVLINVYIAGNDAVGVNIAEIGVFGGSTATTAANSGVLLARGLYTHANKLNTESIVLQLDWSIN